MYILYNVYYATTTVQTTRICTRSAVVANYYHRTRVKIREKPRRDDRSHGDLDRQIKYISTPWPCVDFPVLHNNILYYIIEQKLNDII